MGDEKKINRQFKNNFNGILNRAKQYPLWIYKIFYNEEFDPGSG